MVRVLFIRHGMTVSNLADARMAIRVAKGQVDGHDASRIRRDESIKLGFDEGAGDTNLSDYKGGGIAEAQQFGEYWGNILSGKAEAGQLHIFVSPMQRCCQTADPFMKLTHCKGTIQPLIFEVPGLCAPIDRVFLDEKVRPLYDASNEKAGKLLFESHTWSRAGFSSNDLQTKFPWIETFVGFPRSKDIPWWKGMWELPHETSERLEKAKTWLFDLAQTLPEDDVVLLFSHGDTIWRLLSLVVGIDVENIEHATANTSVSSVSINTSANGKYNIQLDFYNRTPHLVQYNDDVRNLDFYKSNGLAKRQNMKSRQVKTGQVDLSLAMRALRMKSKEFMAKL
jgi:broad specificity phosphatase PhoE